MEPTFSVDPYDIDQLMYCSLAADNLSPADVQAIVEQAQAANRAAEITGMLMVHEGIFVQWIEGPRQAVLALWQKLLSDPRHRCVVKLLANKDLQHRSFADWSMKLVPREYLLKLIEEADYLAKQEAPTPWMPAIEGMLKLLRSAEPRDEVEQMERAS
jgi:Sensors of blue-light using FAD